MDKIEPMDWEEMQMNIGSPVYDKKEKRWRILEGYKRIAKDYYVTFTDNNNRYEITWERFRGKELYLKEV